MKLFNNSRGSVLIILVIAITLIAILGASFVSLVGSKQRGFTFLLNGQRANNMAKAGVEWEIRFASDGTDVNGNSIFFSNQALTVSKNYSGGSFSTSYVYDQNIANDILTVTGTYPVGGGSTKKIRLTNFRRYISPITLVPLASSRPHISGNDTIVPIISNYENNFTVDRIEVTVPAISGTYLNILRDSTSIFNYSSTTYLTCDAIPVAPCKDKDSVNGIYISSGSTVRFDLSSPAYVPDTLYTYTLRFSPVVAPAGQYTMKIYTSLPSGNPFTIQFSL